MSKASLVDVIAAYRGRVRQEYEGAYWAAAATREWHREENETEAQFLARVRREAVAAGYATCRIGGAINLK